MAKHIMSIKCCCLLCFLSIKSVSSNVSRSYKQQVSKNHKSLLCKWQTHTHTHTPHTMTQMDKLTNVKPSMSFDVDLKVSCKDSALCLDRASMRYMEAKGQRYNSAGALLKSSRCTDNRTALGLDTKAHKLYPSAAQCYCQASGHVHPSQ